MRRTTDVRQLQLGDGGEIRFPRPLQVAAIDALRLLRRGLLPVILRLELLPPLLKGREDADGSVSYAMASELQLCDTSSKFSVMAPKARASKPLSGESSLSAERERARGCTNCAVIQSLSIPARVVGSESEMRICRSSITGSPRALPARGR